MAAPKTKTHTPITAEILERVERLAEQGFNNKMIAQALGMAATTMTRNKLCKQSIQKGKLKLAEAVTEKILASEDTAVLTMLMKRLGLFTTEINIKRPHTTEDALNNIAAATKQYALNEITDYQLKTIQSASDSFIRGHDMTTIVKRLEALENNQDKEHG